MVARIRQRPVPPADHARWPHMPPPARG